MNSELIVQWAQAHGSDAKEPRDAAHEGYHGWSLGVSNWDREEIHAAIMELDRPYRVRQEVEARAVEWIVCEELGIDYDLSHWCMISAMEAVHSGVSMPLNYWKEGVENMRRAEKVQELAAMLRAECS